MEDEHQAARGSDYGGGEEGVSEATPEGKDERGCGERGYSEEWLGTTVAKERFLAAHKLGMSVVNAARVAGVERRTIYRWRDKDPAFAKAWRQAREGLVEDLEMEAYKRAFKGNDRLLMFLLRSYKPVTYNPVTYNPRQQQGKKSQQQPKSRGGKAVDLVELVDKVREWK